ASVWGRRFACPRLVTKADRGRRIACPTRSGCPDSLIPDQPRLLRATAPDPAVEELSQILARRRRHRLLEIVARHRLAPVLAGITPQAAPEDLVRELPAKLFQHPRTFMIRKLP